MKRFVLSSLMILASSASFADMPIDCTTTYSYSQPMKDQCTTMLQLVDQVVQNDLKHFRDKVAKGEQAINDKEAAAAAAAAAATPTTETTTTAAPPPAAATTTTETPAPAPVVAPPQPVAPAVQAPPAAPAPAAKKNPWGIF